MIVKIVIPARLESSRLPRKLLLSDTGKPLICHAVESALKVQSEIDCISSVIVATDSPEIVSAVSRYDIEARLTGHHESGTDRIASVATGDIVINWQGDEPEISTIDIQSLITTVQGSDISTLVRLLQIGEKYDRSVVKAVVSYKARCLYFAREFISGAYAHCGVYCYTRESLNKFVSLPQSYLEKLERLEQLRAIENDMIIKATITGNTYTGIDTQYDYDKFCREYKSS